mmetsp:Transcript_24072/g.60875  ORF Transcript_24072/g.60875 Transcript_24072/m.60875 type:complete len:206 (+) Transcript_24072:716-1333(+)
MTTEAGQEVDSSSRISASPPSHPSRPASHKIWSYVMHPCSAMSSSSAVSASETLGTPSARMPMASSKLTAELTKHASRPTTSAEVPSASSEGTEGVAIGKRRGSSAESARRGCGGLAASSGDGRSVGGSYGSCRAGTREALRRPVLPSKLPPMTMARPWGARMRPSTYCQCLLYLAGGDELRRCLARLPPEQGTVPEDCARLLQN